MAELIVALDLPTGAEALRLVDRLPDVRWVKVGSIVVTREGAPLVRELVGRGLRVFLDLKWHDIPNTVAGAVRAAAELGVAMATVHTLGGEAMLRAAADAAAEAERGPALVGVTVLTSHDRAGYGAAVGRADVALEDEVGRLADTTRRAGLTGIVCSPHEVAAMRARLGPEAWLVTPGIRRAGDARGDQTRTAGAAEAVRLGATHLVVGRPILQASDPAAAFAALHEEAVCAT